MEKEKIYYNRTYRRIKLNIKHSLIFCGAVVLPVLVFYLFELEHLIHQLVMISYQVLAQVIPKECIQIQTTEYSKFWTIEYLVLPTNAPKVSVVCLHLLVCLLLLFVMKCMRKTGNPMSIFLLYCVFVHIVNSIFLFVASDSFPYTIGDYSELYLKQQMSIWLMFLVMAGVVLGSWGNTFLRYRIAAFFGICLYSLLFGTVRYIFFLFVLYRFSIIFMAMMFFVIGPMVDFAYFVVIYAAYMNKMTKEYGRGNKKGEWVWS